MFPYNLPQNVHWIGVFAWLTSHGVIHLCHSNSSPGFTNSANLALQKCKTLLLSLQSCPTYRPAEMTALRFHNVQCVVPNQAPGSLTCGEHTLAACDLATRGKLLTHTFNHVFVSRTRLRIVDALLRHRTPSNRRRTPMSAAYRPTDIVAPTIDLTSSDTPDHRSSS